MAADVYEIDGNENPVRGGVDSPRATAGLVIGSLAALILIKRGFSGGVSGNVNVKVR